MNKQRNNKTSMPSRYRILFSVILSLLGMTLCFCLIIFSNQSRIVKTGYVRTEQVYEEFDLKKQLSSQLSDIGVKRKNEMDSLILRIKMTENQISNKTNPSDREITLYKQLLDEYEIRSEQYEEEQNRLSSSYNEQIINQINRHIKEYGIANNYDIIHGTDGSGNIMYADESLDITIKVIQYINKKHAGFN